MIEEKYLSGREYSALLSLFAQVSHFTVLLPLLEDRIRMVPGLWEKMQEAEALTREALEALPYTIPMNKRKHVLTDVKAAKIYIKIEPPGCVPTIDMKSFSYLPTKTLNQLLCYVMEHECLMCDKTPTEARRCQVRDMFDNALPHEVTAKDKEHCKYSDMSMGFEE